MLERPARDPDRLHRDAQATGVEALHRVPEPLALLAQEVVGREPHVLERERDGVRGPEAHLILRLPRTITGDVGGHNKRADPALRAGHHHHEIRRAAVRGPGFRARLHPARASPHRARGQRRGVGAGLGLRQREPGQQVAARHRLEPAMLLRGAPMAHQHRGGNGVVDRERHRDARVRGGDLLEREEVGDAVESHPVVLLGRAHAEEPEPAELVDHVAGEVRPPVPLGRERLDLGAREFARQLFRPRRPAATSVRSSGAARYLSSPRSRCSTSRIARQTSSPIRSASANGPTGWFIPSFMTVSIASGVATPSITQKIASLIIGMSTRFDTNPGASFTSTGVLPNAFATSTTSATVLSAVSRPRTTSTSGMTGTGFMKCIPITCAGRLVWAAIAVMEMEEVLLARIAAGGARRSMSRKILNLTSGCSVAASTTRWASATESRFIEVRIRASAASRCSAVTDPFFTCRSRFVLMTASTRSSKPGATSIR